MKQFLILGAFGNSGFNCCFKLLEEGYPVFHFNVSDEYLDTNIIEEKRLQIGRNSNFTELDQNPFDLVPENDLYIIIPEKDWLEHSNQIKVHIEEQIPEVVHQGSFENLKVIILSNGQDEGQIVKILDHLNRDDTKFEVIEMNDEKELMDLLKDESEDQISMLK